VFGFAGRAASSAYLYANQQGVTFWLRTLVLYAGTGGLLLLVVSRAMRRVEGSLAHARAALVHAAGQRLEREHAEAQVRAHERRLRIALEAGSVMTFSVDPATRAISWDPGGAVPRGVPFDRLPPTVGGMVALIPDDERPRITAA